MDSIVPFILGLPFGALLLKLSDEIFFKKRERRADKKQLANDALVIINEARTSQYNAKPRSLEHCNYIAHRVQMEDEDAGRFMHVFVQAWGLCGEIQTPGSQFAGSNFEVQQELAQILQKTAKDGSDDALKIIKRWLK